MKIKGFESGQFATTEVGNRYANSRYGKRFAITDPDPGATILGGTSFNVTAPSFLISQNDSTARLVLSGFTISLVNEPGGLVFASLVIDSAYRYVSGGLGMIPLGMNADKNDLIGAEARTGALVTLAGTGTRVMQTFTAPNVPGHRLSITEEDGVMIGQTGAILFYVWSAAPAPEFILSAEVWEEE